MGALREKLTQIETAFDVEACLSSLLTVTRKFWNMIGTSPYIFGPYRRHSKLTKEIVCLLVGWLLNVQATCECISGTDLLRQFYVLPH